MNRHTPPDIDLTDESFTCTAFFGGQVIDLVPVRLEVKLIEVLLNDPVGLDDARVKQVRLDIWAVSEFIKGEQHDLFLDPETVKSRLAAFLPERS